MKNCVSMAIVTLAMLALNFSAQAYQRTVLLEDYTNWG